MGRSPQLEIEERHGHHVRAWKVKRIGWTILALVIISALAGLFGRGPLSEARARSLGGLDVEYHRILRYNAPSRLTITVPDGSADLELSWDSRFLGKIAIERVEPEPTEYRLDGDRHTWIFTRTNTKSPARIFVTYRPEVFGAAAAHLQARGFGQLELKQIFLP